MSMYAEYVQERTNDFILETTKGFVTYRYTDEKTCYIIDIYTHPDFRKKGEAGDLADLVVGLAKQRGCSTLLGSVAPSTKGSTTSLRVLLGYGMTLQSSGPDYIIFRKDI